MLKRKKYILLKFQTHNLNREKQVILLMIPNGKGREVTSKGQRRLWHYLAVKN